MRISFIIFNSFLLCASLASRASVFSSEAIDTSSHFITLPAVLKSQFQQYLVKDSESKNQVDQLCSKIKQRYAKYKWDSVQEGCGDQVKWKTRYFSHSGEPLIWTEFGSGTNTTLILGGVHPDEITPVPMAFRFANHLQKNPHLVPADSQIIVAPLVNPDGFFKPSPSRTNKNGVDLNRNFFTTDWYSTAKHWWSDKRKNDLRHFPGHIPNSEIETLFQIWLIDTFKPDKIISIHSPLGFYDYDGPGERKIGSLTESEKKGKKLVFAMSSSSKNYKVVDYSFYPGSLGNYAGNERGIPTITLELETTNPQMINKYWTQFSPGLEQAIKFPFVNPKSIKAQGASLFLEAYHAELKTDKSRLSNKY